MSGQGTPADPWDLATALSVSPAYIGPGHILHLNNSTAYTGDFTNLLYGTSALPVMVKPITTAKIDGSVTLSGKYVTFRDIEFCWTGWIGRVSEEAGSEATDLALKNITGTSVGYAGVGLKFINCIIHDLSGPYFDDYMIGLELNGCLIYHIGWKGSDRGHGHGLYLHNIAPSMKVKDCIIFDNHGWGIHAYSPTGGVNLKNFIFEGNTCFNAGILAEETHPNYLVGGDVGGGAADTISLIDNMGYNAGGLQFYGDGATGVTLTGNYMPDGKTGTYTAITESGNYFEAAVGNQVFVRPNDNDIYRANVTIYNEAVADSVVVDLSSVTGIAAGNSVTVANVQDYFTDIQTLVVSEAGTITIDMRAISHTVGTPQGWTAPATTFPTFGCFVVEKA